MFTMSKVNKLEGSSNYAIWKAKMKTIFMKEKLWGIVCPTSRGTTIEGMSIGTSIGTSTKATTPLTMLLRLLPSMIRRIKPWQFCCYRSKMTSSVT